MFQAAADGALASKDNLAAAKARGVTAGVAAQVCGAVEALGADLVQVPGARQRSSFCSRSCGRRASPQSSCAARAGLRAEDLTRGTRYALSSSRS